MRAIAASIVQSGEEETMIIAAQMWIFSRLPELDAQTIGLLRGLAECGYESIEALAGRAPHDLATLQATLIKCGAVHLVPSGMEPLEPLLDFLYAVGARHVCSSGPLQWNARTAEDYVQTAAYLNARGQQLREHGIGLHYHNHEFEFDRVDGDRTAMDILLEELDPAAVTLCFDAGWAERAGQNAARFLAEHAALVQFLHLRDFRGLQSVPLGQGDIDLAAQIALLPSLPTLEYLVVEQDPSATPLNDMQASRRYLRDTFGL